MNCCPLSEGDNYPSISTELRPRARKEHKCYECREIIPKGVIYEKVSGVWDGRFACFKTCLSCVEIRNHFGCGEGWAYGYLWEDLAENFFRHMTAGGPCFEGLSPEAKGRLFERRLHWLGFYDV